MEKNMTLYQLPYKQSNIYNGFLERNHEVYDRISMLIYCYSNKYGI